MPKLYEKFIFGSSAYLVTQFMPYNLSTLIMETKNNYNEQHMNVIMYNLLCAMAFVHSAGVVHGDITPENILLDEDCRVKICGFSKAWKIIEKSKEDETESLDLKF
jgi:serine/threonine protein kinase